MEELLPELKSFIIDFCKRQKLRQIDLDDLSVNTTVYPDLDIEDLDVDLLLTDFIGRFDVDYSDFTWANHRYPTGSVMVDIVRMFGYKKEWVKRLASDIYGDGFKVQILQDAIKTGKLI